jgi:hypothetical protein
MGEYHVDKIKDSQYYINIIRKQKEIINLCIDKFGQDKTYFYSEAPEEHTRLVLATDMYSSAVIAQYAKTKIPIKLSSITGCDRRYKGYCDDKYCDDILSIFDNNSEINCIIVAIGLLHIPELKRFIISRRPDIKIIIVNTVSEKQLNPLIPEIKKQFPSVIDLLTIEQPYDLPEPQSQEDIYTFLTPTESASAVSIQPRAVVVPRAAMSRESAALAVPRARASASNGTFNVEVLHDADGKKIYKCPACNMITGYAAPEDPYNTSFFAHNPTCPNKGKIPVESKI